MLFGKAVKFSGVATLEKVVVLGVGPTSYSLCFLSADQPVSCPCGLPSLPAAMSSLLSEADCVPLELSQSHPFSLELFVRIFYHNRNQSRTAL